MYTSKLDELKAECEPIESRAREAEQRPAAVNSLHTLASSYLAAAMGDDAKYAHLSQEERRQVSCLNLLCFAIYRPSSCRL